MEPVSASRLRQDVYRLLDQVIETGVPLEIVRGGHRLRIELDAQSGRLQRLVGNGNPDAIVGDPDDLVALDVSAAWDPDRALAP